MSTLVGKDVLYRNNNDWFIGVVKSWNDYEVVVQGSSGSLYTPYAQDVYELHETVVIPPGDHSRLVIIKGNVHTVDCTDCTFTSVILTSPSITTIKWPKKVTQIRVPNSCSIKDSRSMEVTNFQCHTKSIAKFLDLPLVSGTLSLFAQDGDTLPLLVAMLNGCSDIRVLHSIDSQWIGVMSFSNFNLPLFRTKLELIKRGCKQHAHLV